MNELTAHIQALNAKSYAWVAEDPTRRFASILVSDAMHWADYGITTVEQFEHYMLATDVYESYKDAYGFHPNWKTINDLSDEDLQKMLVNINNDMTE